MRLDRLAAKRPGSSRKITLKFFFLVTFIVLTRRLRQGRDVSRLIVDKFDKPYTTEDGMYGDCALVTHFKSLPRNIKHVGLHLPGCVSHVDTDALVVFVRNHSFETIQVDVSGAFITTFLLDKLMAALAHGARLIFIPRCQTWISSGPHVGVIRYKGIRGQTLDWIETEAVDNVIITHEVDR